jgi:hypothetical protein
MTRAWRDFSAESGDVASGVPTWGTQYYHDGDNVLSSPWPTTAGAWADATSVVDASGTKLLQFENGTGGSRTNVIVDTETGSVSGDAEIYLRFRFTGAPSTEEGGVCAFLRFRPDTGSTTNALCAYSVTLYDGDNSSGESIWRECYVYRASSGTSEGYVSGVSDIHTTSGLGTVDQDEDWCIRFQVVSNVFKARVWPASGSEPAWQKVGTSNTAPTDGGAWTAGYIGFAAHTNTTSLAVVGMGIATGSDITDVGAGAPTAPLSGSIVPQAMANYRMRVA